MAADLLNTLDLCAALKTFLAAIDHPTLSGEKLFEVVDFHDNKSLGQALTDLIIIKGRVCLVVPSGDRYQRTGEGRTVRSDRTTSLDLVLADRSYVKGGQAAVFGGPDNVGVIAMKDIVVAQLGENSQLDGLRWCSLAPIEGAPLTLTSEDQAKAASREAYVLNYETPTGWITASPTTRWPVVP